MQRKCNSNDKSKRSKIKRSQNATPFETLETRRKRILEKFEEAAVNRVDDQELLRIMQYVIGYRQSTFRPILTSLSCEVVGGKAESAEDVGLMFFLASAGFGVHDDLIDKSKNKHFRMTILGLYGFEKALLAGDLLIMKGWTMIKEMLNKDIQPKIISRVIDVYGNLSIEICEAQFLEIACRKNLNIDIESYLELLWKEMAEAEACSKTGAIIGGGSENEINALATFGRRLGFLSRLEDDVKDCLNEDGSLAHRIRFESIPLPLLYAAKTSTDMCKKIDYILQKQDVAPSDLAELMKFCFETEAFRYIVDLAKKVKSAAIADLRILKPNKSRKTLNLMLLNSYRRLVKKCL